MKKNVCIILIISVLLSCEQDYSLNIPTFDSDIDEITTRLNFNQKDLLNGIYQVKDSNKKFGDSLVFKFSNNKLSIFCGKNAAYMILNGGISGDSLIFRGYWRFAESEETGRVQITISYREGAEGIINGDIPGNLIVRGWFSDEGNSSRKDINWLFSSPLKINMEYWIIAHRGGGRNADMLPHSENSIELLRIAESLGANAVEIDVQLTKDNIPVLYHDKNLNNRLIDGEYMVGSLSNYYLYQLKNFCRLKNGEQMPTLEEALNTIINETNIGLVWLDIKSAASLQYILPLIDKYQDSATSIGREVKIYPGIPASDILEAFQKNEDYNKYPTICELEISDAESVNSAVWAPRWTLGFQPDQVNKMHSQGRKAVVWTVDNRDIMREFIRESDFDGMVTNYPAMAAYEFYTK